MKKLGMALAVLVFVSAALAGSMEMTSARLYRKQGELFKSLQFYNTELQKNPGNVEALFERGEMTGEVAIDSSKFGMQKEFAKSILLAHLAADTLLNPVTRDSLGRQIEANGIANPQRALFETMLMDFNKVRNAASNKDAKKMGKKMDEMLNRFWATYYSAATKSDTLENYDKALAQLDVAKLFKPLDWHTDALVAQLFEKKQQPEKALEAWERAHQYLETSGLKKDKPEEYKQAMDVIRARLLEGYYNLENYPKAIEYADEMSKDDPTNSDAVQFKAFSLAQLAADTSNTSEQRDSLRAVAVAALNEAKKARPDYAPIMYTIGQFNIQLGDTAEALKAFEEYLTKEPSDRDALFVVGVLYLEGGSYINTEKARDTFKTLTETHADDGAAWINFGIATIRLGDNVNGKKYIEKGKELNKP